MFFPFLPIRLLRLDYPSPPSSCTIDDDDDHDHHNHNHNHR
jgi:hypothetical protein